MDLNDFTYKTSFLLFRQLRRKTQQELAEIVKISPAQLYKYEQGIATVSDPDLLLRFGEALDVPSEAFNSFSYSDYRPIISMINFRVTKSSSKSSEFNKSKASLKRQDELDALANIIRWRIDLLVNNTTVVTSHASALTTLQKRYKKPNRADIQKLSDELRQLFNLHLSPVQNVVKIIEQLGIFVLFYNAGENLYEGFDGFSTTLSTGQPLIVVNAQMPSDRIRLTLAHELAHCLLHVFVENKNEQEAWAFAAEFLTPRIAIEKYLHNLSISKLFILKKNWMVSMGSLIMRAKGLETIDEGQNQSLWRVMAMKGYKYREPAALEPPMEKPELLNSLIKYRSNNEPEFDIRKNSFIKSDADYSAFNFEFGEHQPKVLNLTSI